MMKVSRPHAWGRYVFVISAAIVIVRGMERLMQIADEMQQELQGDDALLGAGPPAIAIESAAAVAVRCIPRIKISLSGFVVEARIAG
jgi:hypothetical protein